MNLSKRLARFTNILNSVPGTHAEETKPRRKPKPWMTPYVRAKIRTHNRPQRNIKINQQDLIEACREAKEAINEAKKETRKGVLKGAMTISGGRDMWKVSNGLSGTLEVNSPNEVESQQIKAKANILVNHHERVNNPPITTEDRNLIRRFKKRIDSP